MKLDVLKNSFRFIRQMLLQVAACLLVKSKHILVGKNNVIIAPHPDDEVLGCGGLISKSVANGSSVKVIVLTCGGAAHHDCCANSRCTVEGKRRELAKKALGHLGLLEEHIIFLDWQDGKLPGKHNSEFPDKVQELAALLMQLNPSTVFCPHPFEGWSDHIAAYEITQEAIAQSRLNVSLYQYCVWFWYSMPLLKARICNWRNAFTLDIRDVYQMKQKALAAYMKPLAPCGKPWSGDLPKVFLKAFRWKKELYFRVNSDE